jgi:hypothetical protein
VKNILQNTALLLISLVLSYIVLEAGYRYYLYHQLAEQLIGALYNSAHSASEPGRQSVVFDPDVGWRYEPNRTWDHILSKENHWRTNEHGLIANDIDTSEYPTEKPAGEYRIAVLGDSFAAGNAVYLRWPDLLQDYLNRSPEWRSFVGGRFTRVLNFAMDGTGIVQWGPVYEYRAREFAPDLVIVSYYIDDVMRQFSYLGHTAFSSDEELRHHVEESVHDRLRRLPWFGVYPELLATTLGPYLHLRRQLMPTTSVTTLRFATQELGIRASVAWLERIRCFNPQLLVVRQPALDELRFPIDDFDRWPSTPDVVGLQASFTRAAEAAGFSVIDLTSPQDPPRNARQLFPLYNMPTDSHMSDFGVVMYASWMFKYLMNWIHTSEAAAPGAPACH